MGAQLNKKQNDIRPFESWLVPRGMVLIAVNSTYRTKAELREAVIAGSERDGATVDVRMKTSTKKKAK